MTKGQNGWEGEREREREPECPGNVHVSRTLQVVEIQGTSRHV